MAPLYFSHLVDIAQAWVVYRRHCDALKIPKRQRVSLLSFTASIAEVMINANKVQPVASVPKPGRPKKKSSCGEEDAKSPKVGRKPVIVLRYKDTRYDQVSHWPQPMKEKGDVDVIAKTATHLYIAANARFAYVFEME